jgi:tetratricopeptide (TPR) repeat protein
VARSHQNLAVNLSDLGEYAAAERHYELALEVYRAVYGERHPSIAITVNNLANLKARQDDLTGAERLFRETLTMRRQLFADDHPAVVRAVNNLATVLMRLGRPAESRDDVPGPDGRRERQGQGERPRCPARAGRTSARRCAGSIGSTKRRPWPGPCSSNDARPRPAASRWRPASMVLARILRDRGRTGEAAEHFGQALAIRRERLGEDHADVTSLAAELAALGPRSSPP